MYKAIKRYNTYYISANPSTFGRAIINIGDTVRTQPRYRLNKCRIIRYLWRTTYTIMKTVPIGKRQ